MLYFTQSYCFPGIAYVLYYTAINPAYSCVCDAIGQFWWEWKGIPPFHSSLVSCERSVKVHCSVFIIENSINENSENYKIVCRNG